MKIFIEKKLTIKEVWLKSLQLFVKTFTEVWPQAIAIGITVVILAWMNVNLPIDQFNLKEMTPIKWFYIFAQFVTLLTMFYLGNVVLYRICVIGEEREITLASSFSFVWKKLFRIFCAMLLVILMGMLGILVLVLPGIFIFILFIMTMPLILFDDKSCFAALKGSCKLVWGNWWRSLAVFFPIMFLNFALTFVLRLVTIQYNYLWCGFIGAGLIAVFFYPLFYASLLVQFNDLKLRYTKKQDIII